MNDFERAKQHFIGGLQLLEKNDFHAAETEFARSLELLPDRASTLNNLAAIKIRLKQFPEAEAFARRAIAVESNSTEALVSLATALSAQDRHAEALQFSDQALQHDSLNAKAWFINATILLSLKQYDRVVIACDQSLKLQPGAHDILYLKCVALKELGQMDEAKKTYRQSLEARVAVSPVVAAERRPTQKVDVLILANNPVLNDGLEPFDALLLGCPNYAGQLIRYMADEVHFTYVFMGDAARESSRARIPPAQVLINNYANGELVVSDGNVEALGRLVDSFKIPVLNHPKNIILSTRDAGAKLLEGIPGLVIPKTLRFTSIGKSEDEVIKEVEALYDYPFITRSLTGQVGRGMNLVESCEKFSELLKIKTYQGIEENFFVTQFYDCRGGNPNYRKLRAAVVNKEIIIVRADYDTYWNIHGRRLQERSQFYLDRPHLLEAEKRICHDLAAELGQPAMDALKGISEKMPLEVFGIDFDVNLDGHVVFFEANATMNLFPTAWHTVPNPRFAEERLKDAFVRYFRSLAGRH